MHVHVDSDALRAAPRGTEAQVRHLGPHAGQAQQAGDRVRDVVAEARVQQLGRGFDVARLVVVEADGVDERVEGRGVDGADGGEREAGGGEGALQGVDRGGRGGVFGLGGEHQRDEGLEALVLGTRAR